MCSTSARPGGSSGEWTTVGVSDNIIDVAERTPSAGYTLTLRVNLRTAPGHLGALTTAIGRAGGDIGAVDIVAHRGAVVVRDISVKCVDEEHGRRIVEAASAVEGAEVRSVSDRTFEIHHGGKIAIHPKFPVKSRDDLSMAYTPGVGRVAKAIAEDHERVWDLTVRGNSVAVLTDGSAVLGLGNLGPEAALPVMEGKAMLFKEFAGIDAWPICLNTQDHDEIVRAVQAIAPGFGAINLEDISSPRCFEIERRLKAALDIPVMHDDQHGTAVVILAALTNALTITGKRMEEIRVVVNGLGAAGTACCRMLLAAGLSHLVGCEPHGIVLRGDGQRLRACRTDLTSCMTQDRPQGTLQDALKGADVFI